MGWVVDRLGPRRVRIGGLFPHYGWLLPATAVAGVANAVYHPSDYAILGVAIEPSRVGRAFSFHTFAGYLGSAIAPPVMLLVSTHAGLTGALLVAALIGPCVALALSLSPRLDVVVAATQPASRDGASCRLPLRRVASSAILGLTVFFALLSLSTGEITNFSVVALTALHNVQFVIANTALSAFLCATALGVLTGGVIADRTRRHGDVAATALLAAAAVTFLVGSVPLRPVTLIAAMAAAGGLSPMIAPSRDMMLRAAAPPGAAGRAFAIVTTGFNIGGTVGPMPGGWIMDRGAPRSVFFASVLFMLTTAATALATEWRGRATRADRRPSIAL